MRLGEAGWWLRSIGGGISVAGAMLMLLYHPYGLWMAVTGLGWWVIGMVLCEMRKLEVEGERLLEKDQEELLR